jgi:hypothetical protein
MKRGSSGISLILKNLNKALADVERRGKRALITAGALVRREGQIETPVDKGVLINSWYGPEIHDTAKGPVAEIGLTASYAPFVHENVEAHFQKPGSKAKFVEDPLKRNAERIVEIIAEEMKF